MLLSHVANTETQCVAAHLRVGNARVAGHRRIVVPVVPVKALVVVVPWSCPSSSFLVVPVVVVPVVPVVVSSVVLVVVPVVLVVVVPVSRLVVPVVVVPVVPVVVVPVVPAVVVPVVVVLELVLLVVATCVAHQALTAVEADSQLPHESQANVDPSLAMKSCAAPLLIEQNR